MALFKVVATDQSYVSEEIDAEHAASVFFVVQRLKCREADVLADGVYSYSVRLGANGFWSIFLRDPAAEWENMPAFG